MALGDAPYIGFAFLEEQKKCMTVCRAKLTYVTNPIIVFTLFTGQNTAIHSSYLCTWLLAPRNNTCMQ